MLTLDGRPEVASPTKTVPTRQPRGTPFLAWIGAVAIAAAGLVWAASTSPAAEPVVTASGEATPAPAETTIPSSETVDDGLRDLTDEPIPEGMERILDDRSGKVVGFVPSIDLSIEGGPAPALVLAGRQTEITGFAVVDDTGQQVGWFNGQIGFRSLAETDEPAEVEAIEAHIAELDRIHDEVVGPNGEDLPPPVDEDGTPVGGA